MPLKRWSCAPWTWRGLFTIHVHGCLIRTNTYVPMPVLKDASAP